MEDRKEQVASVSASREAYQERARKLLTKGGIGFAGGFLFALITSISDGNPFHIGFALLVSLFCSGIPYGWELLGKILGHWIGFGSLGFHIVVWLIQFAGAILLGWLTYPIVLTYNLMMGQEKHSKARKIYFALFCVFVGFVVLLLVFSFWPK